MKKLVIIFGIIIVLINSIALFALLNSRDSDISFNMITHQPGMRWGHLLYYSEEERAMDDGLWANIDADRAVRIAHMLIFENDNVVLPYYVMHDRENRIFIVLAICAEEHSVYRVIISQDTGGILLNSIHHGAGIPQMP